MNNNFMKKGTIVQRTVVQYSFALFDDDNAVVCVF